MYMTLLLIIILFEVSSIVDIHTYLMKKQYSIMFRLFKQVFIPILYFSESLAAKRISSNNLQCTT